MKKLILISALIAVFAGCDSIVDKDSKTDGIMSDNAAMGNNQMAQKATVTTDEGTFPISDFIEENHVPVTVRNDAVEVVEKRGKYAKVYKNTDGSFTAVISTEPVHKKNETGEWVDIDINKVAKAAYVSDSCKKMPKYQSSTSTYSFGTNEWIVASVASNDWDQRLYAEFNLTSLGTINNVSSATLYTYHEEIASGTAYHRLSVCSRPSTSTAQTVYNSGYDLGTFDLTATSPDTFGLGQSERDRIKTRANGGGDWWAAGYRFTNESTANDCSIYYARLYLTYN